MKHQKLFLILIIILVLLAACSSSGEESGNGQVNAPSSSESNQSADNTEMEYPTNTPGPLAQRTQAGSFFEINEVGLGSDGYVALTNFTGVEVTLEGLFLCREKECFALPAYVVKGGETVLVASGDGEGLENVIATQFGELRPADGELALFSSENIDDPDALLLYLQWGSTPHALTSLAIERGLWFETSYAPSGPNATRLFRNEESGLWLWE